jgi:glutamate decarboxylase
MRTAQKVLMHNIRFQICPVLKGKMMQTGSLMVGYQPDDRRPNFFRSIISNGAVKKEDIDFMLEELDNLGKDL